jgi:hypothetical protein
MLERPNIWRIAAASVVGSGHRRLGSECQDAHGYRRLPDDALALAVADGAGSARLGGQGAALAVQVMLRTIEEAAVPLGDGEALARLGFARVLEAMEAEAAAHGVAVRELSTTLVAAIVTENAAVIGHIGDGAAVGAREPHAFVTLSLPQNDGEYANETVFLTSAAALAGAHFLRIPGRLVQLALFSDGLQRLALCGTEQAPHLPFFGPLFRFIEAQTDAADTSSELAAFLASPRVAARTDDDLTLVLATRAL